VYWPHHVASVVKNLIPGWHMFDFFSIPDVYIDNRGQFLIPFLNIFRGFQIAHRVDRVLSFFSSRPMGLPHIRLREWESGFPIWTRGQTLWLSRYICTLWNSQSWKSAKHILQKNPQNTEECAADFWCVFPLSIDTGRTHVKSSKW
jgi:hypothetical protein